MNMHATNRKNLHAESGFASIVIAMILILVLSLITVGFAQLMRKEQRSALDKHLSSQAYYAAESGVNDAAKALNAGFNVTKPNCAPLLPADSTPGASFLKSNGATNATSYTCLTIDPTPNELDYGSVGVDGLDQSKIVEITGVDPTNDSVLRPISYMVFSWQASDSTTSFVTGATRKFEKTSNWPYTGVLRLGLTPLVSTQISRDAFITNTSVMFLYPNDSASAGVVGDYSNADYTGDAGGGILDGNCNTANTPLSCKAKISNLGQFSYLLNMRSVYKPSHVRIQAFDSSGQVLSIRNAQSVIDSTGKSQDVLRRIQVHIPSRTTYDHTDYGLETMNGICKQLELLPTSSSNRCTP